MNITGRNQRSCRNVWNKNNKHSTPLTHIRDFPLDFMDAKQFPDVNCAAQHQSETMDTNVGSWNDCGWRGNNLEEAAVNVSVEAEKKFDYDTWISQQIRLKDKIIEIDIADFSIMKKLTKSRLQTNYRYMKGPLRTVDYILKIKYCEENKGYEPNRIKDNMNIVKMIDSPEIAKEAQSWKSIKRVNVGRTIIEMSMTEWDQICKSPAVEIYNNIYMLHKSRKHDPLKQAILFVHESNYCQQDIDTFRENIVEPIEKELYNAEVLLEVPDAKYSISLRAGCVGHINGYPVSDDLSCIHISDEELDEVYCKLLGTIEGFVSVAKIPQEEIKRYFQENGTQLPNSCYHVFFASEIHCRNVQRNHKDMMPYLVCNKMIDGSQSIELALNIKWYVRPFRGRASLTIKNPNELTFAIEVLKRHNIIAEFFIEDNRTIYNQLDLKWGGSSRETPAHDEKVFSQIVHKALDVNYINYTSFRVDREPAKRTNPVFLINRIHQRLVRAAINSGCWDRKIPVEDEDWEELMEDAHALPWHVVLGHDYPFRDSVEGSASIVFTENFEMAEKIIGFLLERSPDKDTFTLNPMDRLGVRFFPIYRLFRYIPLNIRAACQQRIIGLDKKWRSQKNSNHLNWLRLKDCSTNRDECRLTVEGWPKSNVVAAAEKLVEACRGYIFDCTRGHREVLFTDFGDAFIFSLNEKYNGTVVFLVDRVNLNITLFAADSLLFTIESQLLKFVDNWQFFIVETSLTIDRPRYFPNLRDIIRKLPQSLISSNNGGGDFHYMYDSVYNFKGQVHQFRELVDLFETMQATIENVYAESESCRPICPICFIKVDLFSNFQLSTCGHYYCLPCLSRMLKHYIQTRELPIRCCVSECALPIAVKDIIFLFMGNVEMPSRFLYEKFKPLVQSILDVSLTMNPHLKHCSTPDCIGINILSSVPGSTTVCNKCGVVRCGQCCESVHEGFTCEYYKKIIDDVTLSIEEFRKTKGTNVRNCPIETCQAVIEKSAGCNHMQCPYCKCHFCWLCDFNNYCQKNVYIHLNEVHGGAGGGWRVENDMIVDFPDDIAEDVFLAAALENALEL